MEVEPKIDIVTLVLFSRNSNGSLCLCVDYHGLNCISKKDCYPLPLISDLLSTAGKAQIYTTLDLCHAYYLICITEGNEWKMAFRTCYGSFEWLVMPFGLTNTHAAFQRFMNDIFSDMLDVHVIIYLDDILVYSDNPTEHKKHVREVLRHLCQNRLYCKSEKCHFDKDTVNYLGFVLPQNGSNYTGLAWTTKGERHSIFPRFCKLLLLFHLKLLWPTHLAHLQRCPLELLWCCLQILPIIENCVHYCSYPYSLDSQQTTYRQDGRLRLCSGCYPLITAWFWWNPPCGFPLLYIHPARTQLWYPQ